MSEVALQGKQRALIRVAESRVATLDAVSASKGHASRCIQALPVSPAVLKNVGVATGAAATVLGVLAGLRRKKKSAEKKVAKDGNSPVSVAVQLLTPLILPLIQRSLRKMADNQESAVRGRQTGF